MNISGFFKWHFSGQLGDYLPPSPPFNGKQKTTVEKKFDAYTYCIWSYLLTGGFDPRCYDFHSCKPPVFSACFHELSSIFKEKSKDFFTVRITLRPQFAKSVRFTRNSKERKHLPTWRIIPFSKWLITLVSKSPKDRVILLPNGLNGL